MNDTTSLKSVASESTSSKVNGILGDKNRLEGESVAWDKVKRSTLLTVERSHKVGVRPRKRHHYTIDLEAFFKHVRVAERGCWMWAGPPGRAGYGSFQHKGAHRVAWVIAHRKDIPLGKWVIHSCDHPLCVRPKHVRLGNAKTNARDMVKRRRAWWLRAEGPMNRALDRLIGSKTWADGTPRRVA